MNFYQRLLATSSLAAGTVWELLTHPKIGTSVIAFNSTAILDSSIESNQILLAKSDNIYIVEERLDSTILLDHRSQPVILAKPTSIVTNATTSSTSIVTSSLI